MLTQLNHPGALQTEFLFLFMSFKFTYGEQEDLQ